MQKRSGSNNNSCKKKLKSTLHVLDCRVNKKISQINRYVMNATKHYSNRIAFVFDFDETLIPGDSFSVMLSSLGLDPEEFTQKHIDPLIESGWDKYLARAYCMINESQQRDKPIIRTLLSDIGSQLEFIQGVEETLEAIIDCANKNNEKVEVEFYLISGGFIELARSTSIAKYFKQMWGCEFSYNDNDEIDFIKTQMTHTEKTRYLYQLSYGVEQDYSGDIVFDYRDIPSAKLHVPLSQTIYVGDGTSDVPCFTVIKEYNGISIGIHKSDKSAQNWEHRKDISSSQKLDNLVPADYSSESELKQSLLLAVEFLCKKIKLIELSIGE